MRAVHWNGVRHAMEHAPHFVVPLAIVQALVYPRFINMILIPSAKLKNEVGTDGTSALYVKKRSLRRLMVVAGPGE